MLPSVLLAATFCLPVEWTFTFKTVDLQSVPPWRSGGGVPLQYAIEVWGDPPHLRNYPWNGRSLPFPTNTLPNPTPTHKEVKPIKPEPVVPPDPTEQRIKAIETVIAELKARGGSAAVIEQLQRDVDELKAARKKSK